MFLGQSSGTIIFYYTVDGSTDRGIISSATVPSTTPSTTSPTWVRVVADASGGTNVSATFYTSIDGVTWTALGTAGTNTPAGPMFSGSSAVTVAQWGDNVGGFVGRFYKAEIRNLAGTLVDSIDLTSATTGATVTGAAGAVWTAGSASTITTTRQVNPSQLVPGADRTRLRTVSGIPSWTHQGVLALTYSTTIATNATLADMFTIVATNGTAFSNLEPDEPGGGDGDRVRHQEHVGRRDGRDHLGRSLPASGRVHEPGDREATNDPLLLRRHELGRTRPRGGGYLR